MSRSGSGRSYMLVRILTLLLAVSLVGVVGYLGYRAVAVDAGPYEIAVFREPESFCAEVNAHSFVDQIEGVATEEDVELRSTLGEVRAGFLRRTAALEDTPPALGPRLEVLGTEVEVAGANGDFSKARLLAFDLDEDARSFCR